MDSPCNLVCTIDTASGWCLGCGRTLDEIGGWSSATAAERQAIWSSLDERLTALGCDPATGIFDDAERDFAPPCR